MGKQGHEIQEPACSLQPKTPEQEVEVKSGECIWKNACLVLLRRTKQKPKLVKYKATPPPDESNELLKNFQKYKNINYKCCMVWKIKS